MRGGSALPAACCWGMCRAVEGAIEAILEEHRQQPLNCSLLKIQLFKLDQGLFNLEFRNLKLARGQTVQALLMWTIQIAGIVLLAT